jgi:diguanylate cyclase (GGDEF)-like protein/PAS domain S-box-containing protein
VADLPDIDSRLARHRQFAYAATFAVLFFGYLYLRNSTWRGDVELHTLMETVATVLSLAVGCLALVRFYSRKDNKFLFIGTGFVATAFLDGYHAVISSSHFIESFPSFPPSHTVWSWFASRTFLSLLLWLSWLFWRREDRLGAAGRVSERLVFWTVTALALALFAVVEFLPMPATYYQRSPIPRPQEFVPALFFLLALIGYLRKGKWKTNLFEHWLVLSLIVGFMGQAMFMSFSGRRYDMMFDAAHLLKAGSYLCALVGLLLSMQRLFSDSLAQQELAFTNTILATQQEASPDAILVVDERTNIISHNRRFVDLWGLTQEMVAARVVEPVLHLVAAKVQYPEAFVARVNHLYEHRLEECREEIGLKDGRTIDAYSAPMVGTDGRYYGRIWFFRDITERRHAEQTAVDERLFSDTLIASQPDIFFVLDSTGRFIRWNDKLKAVLGYSDTQIAASNALAVIYEADRPSVGQKIQEAFEQGAASINARIVTKTGIRDYRFKATRADTAKGAYLVGIGTDITERKQAEQALRDSENRYRSLVETTSDWVWEVDENAVYTYVSPRALAITGYQPAELIGKTPFDLMTPEEAKRVANLFGPLIAAQQPIINLENTCLHKDGHAVVLESSGVPVIDADGKLCGYRGIDRDITERKQAQTELHESELAYRTLAQNLPGMVYRVYVREGERMQFYNAMPVLMTGYTEGELTTGTVCSIEPLILDEDRPGVMAEVKRAIAGKRAFAVEYRLKHKDGGIRWMAEHGMPVYGTDGAPLYIDGVIFDITEHKHAEIELQLFRTLIDSAPDEIHVVDNTTLRIIDANESAFVKLGYTREELLALRLPDVDTADPERLNAIGERMLNGNAITFETYHRRKDGVTFPVEVTAQTITLDRSYSMGIARDITERKLVEAEVQKLHEQLREQAVHDPLTGLYNRRYLDEAIGRELIRSARNKQPIGIVMCDLDHFKAINDTYGHLVGDEVLRMFADLLRKYSRGSDIVCRFGGEEFLLFLPDMPPDVAYQRAEQLRTALAVKQITSGTTVIQVTASFGVATFPENGKTQDALIHAADVAMYQAKEAGRNRVVVSSVHGEDV